MNLANLRGLILTDSLEAIEGLRTDNGFRVGSLVKTSERWGKLSQKLRNSRRDFEKTYLQHLILPLEPRSGVLIMAGEIHYPDSMLLWIAGSAIASTILTYG